MAIGSGSGKSCPVILKMVHLQAIGIDAYASTTKPKHYLGAYSRAGRLCPHAKLGTSSFEVQIMMVLRRVMGAIFGLLLAVAGLVAAGYIQFDFTRGRLLSGAVGLLVPTVLMLSAFYMAFRMVKHAAAGRTKESSTDCQQRVSPVDR